MKKQISALLSIVLVVMSLAACQAQKEKTPAAAEQKPAEQAQTKTPETPTTAPEKTALEGSLRFMWWGGESRHKATVEAVDAFIKKNPGLNVAYEYSGFSGYFDKLLTQMAGNNAPDLVQLSYTAVNEYIVRGQLQPLNEYIDNGTLDISQLDRTLLDTYKVDGKYYAIPTGVNTLFLFYNKTLFDKFGIAYPTTGMTMDEVYAKAKEFTEAARAAGEQNVWGITPTTGGFETIFQRNIIDLGGQLWKDDLSAAAFHDAQEKLR